ncbi:4-hydroxy-tetrahydrodipicolinate synthase [Nitratireductor soli]|uniref:4-hydroxy-tetrahydrodipicolinate synthase n=1 Tax=Nitratireductor soli TaxID=1670619 RepID=UPI00065DE366|nr:4-hydroxy-tetrahydrodipicolinate synthase [Nitratireductor soli]
MDSYDLDRFRGVFTALVTPFKSGAIDHASFDALVERQLAAGIAGLVPVGTTGEAASLSDAEADDLIRRTARSAAGRAFVVAGAGSNSSASTVDKVRRAEAAGADALLVVTPYYNKPTQAGLLRHYAMVAEATALPIMLYSVPGRCGIEIAAETCAILRERHGNIVAIKEAGGSVDRVTRIRRLCGTDFVIHSGDDALTIPFLSTGAVGVTSVVSNIAPVEMVAMVRAWHDGDWRGALALHDQIAELTDSMFLEANPGPVKAALAFAGLAGSEVRAPMAEMDPGNLQRLAEIIDRFRQNGNLFQEMR